MASCPSTAPPHRPLSRSCSVALINRDPRPRAGHSEPPIAGRFCDVRTAHAASTHPAALRSQQQPVWGSPGFASPHHAPATGLAVHPLGRPPPPPAPGVSREPGSAWAGPLDSCGPLAKFCGCRERQPGATVQAPEGQEPWAGPGPSLGALGLRFLSAVASPTLTSAHPPTLGVVVLVSTVPWAHWRRGRGCGSPACRGH